MLVLVACHSAPIASEPTTIPIIEPPTLAPQEAPTPTIANTPTTSEGTVTTIVVSTTPSPEASSTPTETVVLATPPPFEEGWELYQTSPSLSFAYPKEWVLFVSSPFQQRPYPKLAMRLELRAENHLIVVEVHPLRTGLLEWARTTRQLEPEEMENGYDALNDFNASISGLPALFIQEYEHRGTPTIARLYVANDGYAYEFQYFGSIPDTIEGRELYIRFLESVTIGNVNERSLTLPETNFLPTESTQP
jgi:hypothetical protein